MHSETKLIFWVWRGPFFGDYSGQNRRSQNFSSRAVPYQWWLDIFDAKYKMPLVNNKQSVAKKAKLQYLCSDTKSIFWVWLGPFFRIIRAIIGKIQSIFSSCSVSMVTSIIPNMKWIWLILSDLEPIGEFESSVFYHSETNFHSQNSLFSA